MTTLTRLRDQQKPYSVTTSNSIDCDDSPTIRNTFNDEKPAIAEPDQQEQQNQFDLYIPLSPEEADEDQLAEFFNTLDIDVSFGGCDNDVINNISEVSTNTERHSAKRRRLSASGNSYSTSFSDETDDYDDIGLQRKQSAPIE